MRVLKFGGTSMGDEHTWRKVLSIIKTYDQPIVIVSATARTTRRLIAAAEMAVHDYGQALTIAREIEDRHLLLVQNFLKHYEGDAIPQIKNASEEWIEHCSDNLQSLLGEVSEAGVVAPASGDAIAAIGEQLSSRLFSYCGSAFGFQTAWIDACDIIKTDSDFGSANPDLNLINEKAKVFLQQLQEGSIPVMGGYYGQDSQGNTTTLGFEGSDFSASLVGSALNADGIEIWTDVSGIYTCDPRVVEEAYPIEKLSFREATEMAYFGAKVLHPSTMNPAEEKQIPIFVKNIFEPDHRGTKIQGDTSAKDLAKAMTFLSDVVILTVTSPHTRMGYDFLSGVFKVLKEHHVSVNVVTTTEASVSVALQEKKIDSELVQSLKELGEIKSKGKLGIISLIGCRLGKAALISQNVLNTIPETEVSMISYSNDKQNLNIVLPLDELVPSVKAIHRKLFRK